MEQNNKFINKWQEARGSARECACMQIIKKWRRWRKSRLLHRRSVNTLYFSCYRFRFLPLNLSSRASFVGKLSTFSFSLSLLLPGSRKLCTQLFLFNLHIQSAVERSTSTGRTHTHTFTLWGNKLDVLSDLLGISLSTQGDSGHESRKKSFRHESVGGGRWGRGGTVSELGGGWSCCWSN